MMMEINKVQSKISCSIIVLTHLIHKCHQFSINNCHFLHQLPMFNMKRCTKENCINLRPRLRLRHHKKYESNKMI